MGTIGSVMAASAPSRTPCSEKTPPDTLDMAGHADKGNGFRASADEAVSAETGDIASRNGPRGLAEEGIGGGTQETSATSRLRNTQ
ncbi:hypothetical protein Pta02_17470 [Planobispora takensis]|uniref:Uncharacterized protein n=1 Tax=Planobispora takensis TaxID=1367882 RepID=A0A8J3WRM6_9ACTN|nr:hypothetical protein Pta02_17470 [Planobispora takensis]